jgi:hypothetical protein
MPLALEWCLFGQPNPIRGSKVSSETEGRCSAEHKTIKAGVRNPGSGTTVLMRRSAPCESRPRVTTGKAQHEHKIFASPPKPDICAFMSTRLSHDPVATVRTIALRAMCHSCGLLIWSPRPHDVGVGIVVIWLPGTAPRHWLGVAFSFYSSVSLIHSHNQLPIPRTFDCYVRDAVTCKATVAPSGT